MTRLELLPDDCSRTAPVILKFGNLLPNLNACVGKVRDYFLKQLLHTSMFQIQGKSVLHVCEHKACMKILEKEIS